MERWSTSEVCEFIAEKGFEEDVIELFRVNRIRGPVLSLLTDAELKELGVAAMGDRKLLLKLFQSDSNSSFSRSNDDKVCYTNWGRCINKSIFVCCIRMFYQNVCSIRIFYFSSNCVRNKTGLKKSRINEDIKFLKFRL